MIARPPDPPLGRLGSPPGGPKRPEKEAFFFSVVVESGGREACVRGVCQLAAPAWPTSGVRSAPPVRAHWSEVLTDSRGCHPPSRLARSSGRPAVLLPHLAGHSSRRSRLAHAIDRLLPASSRCCADCRPYLEGGALPGRTYHPLAVRPSNGYPSLASLPNAPSSKRCVLRTVSRFWRG